MACRQSYKSGNRPTAQFLCGPGMGGPKKRCACGTMGDLLCDGPKSHRRIPLVDDEHDETMLCSAPLCDGCAVQIRCMEQDFCAPCAAARTVGECLLASPGPASSPLVRCAGVLIAKACLCVRHAVLFDHWHAFEGGELVYADQNLDREKRRDAHRRWLRTATDTEIAHILLGRHLPTGAAE
jgi:hypothetical protein